MHLVQILLPLMGRSGKPIATKTFSAVAAELTDRFGGVTTYMRAPAEGRWKKSRGARPVKDEIVVFEIVCERVSRSFWGRYRKELERRFDQESILIRAQRCELL